MGTSERDFREICIAIIIFHARDQGKRTGGGAVNLLWRCLLECCDKEKEIKVRS